MGPSDRYRVLIVNHSSLLRGMVKDLFEEDERFAITGMARSGSAALACMAGEQPDIVIIDLEMPNGEGLAALQLIMAYNPVPVILLSTYTPESSLQTIQGMRLGAVDYVHKEALFHLPPLVSMTAYFLQRCQIAICNGLSVKQTSSVDHRGWPDSAMGEMRPFQHDRFHRRMDMEYHLRKGLDNQEFHLVYQPVVNACTSEIVGLEALIRWTNPFLGQVPPSEFIPVAEESGLIHEIGEWVLREACRQNKCWQDAGLPELFVAVNLSRRQFNDPRLSRTIRNILEETNLKPHLLELEITENMSMDVQVASKAIRDLKKLGIRVAMDDFGTGYSSLGYLKDVPIDKMKIDQIFIKGLKSKQVNAVIVNTMIVMARNLNLLVVAEGVETDEELQVLRECGCSFVQGYYFSPPVEASRIADMLNQDASRKQIV